MAERDNRGAQRFQRGSGKWPARAETFNASPRKDNLAQLSPRLSASSIVRGSRSSLPPREALILFAVINHPWLLESHAEELADLEFLHADADRLRRAILEAVVDHEAVDSHAVAGRDRKTRTRHGAGAGRDRA